LKVGSKTKSMSAFSAFFIALILLATGSQNGELRRMTTAGTLSSLHQLGVSIKINEANDAIDLDLTGPSNVYYAIGFGSTVMVNTWSIVVNGDGEIGWFEQTLSNHRAGLQRQTKSFEMLANTFQAQTDQRRLQLKTSLTALKSYHPFNIDDDHIDLIWAIGTDSTFVEHIEYGTKTLYYRIDGLDDEMSTPHDVWIYFGDMNLSAMIVVAGMGILFIVLLCYWLWKFYKYLKQRAEDKEMEDYAEDKESNPLLRHFVSDSSNNRYIVV